MTEFICPRAYKGQPFLPGCTLAQRKRGPCAGCVPEKDPGGSIEPQPPKQRP